MRNLFFGNPEDCADAIDPSQILKIVPKPSTPAKVCEKIALLLKAERERKQLSLSAVAERAGLSYQMIAYVERGERIPTIDSFIRITNALETDPVAMMAQAVKDCG